jgi:hypothetical protein
LILYKASKSVVPIILYITNIESNKNKDPKSVYKNKKKLALTLLLDPNNPINTNNGGSILSKKI